MTRQRISVKRSEDEGDECALGRHGTPPIFIIRTSSWTTPLCLAHLKELKELIDVALDEADRNPCLPPEV